MFRRYNIIAVYKKKIFTRCLFYTKISRNSLPFIFFVKDLNSGILRSIVVTYYNTDNSRYYEYIVIYSVTEGLTIMGNGIAQGLIPLKISFPNYTEEFLSVIDEFYIKKKNFIIKNKIRTDDYYITDRPTFLIECYYENKRLLYEFTKLSVEGYNLVFDEKFEKFIRMVKKMVQEYDKKIYNTDTLRQKYW